MNVCYINKVDPACFQFAQISSLMQQHNVNQKVVPLQTYLWKYSELLQNILHHDCTLNQNKFALLKTKASYMAMKTGLKIINFSSTFILQVPSTYVAMVYYYDVIQWQSTTFEIKTVFVIIKIYFVAINVSIISCRYTIIVIMYFSNIVVCYFWNTLYLT